MTDESPRYQQSPLKGAKNFRILELQPGENDDALRCDIKTVSLDDRPNYEALSYVWGIPGNVTPGSTVQGPSNTIIKVTTTCLRALRNLRHLTAPRCLWIDQICIDQESPEEKGHQVRLMGEIYKSATRVLVDPTGAVGWRNLDLGSLLCLLNWGRRARNEPELPIPSRVQQRYDNCATVFDVEGVKPFLEGWCFEVMAFLKWFERTWAIQEVALAKEAVMILGTVQVPFHEVLAIFVDQLDFHKTRYRHRASSEYPERLQLHASMRGARKRSLLELAYNARFMKTTKPADRLFSLVGLASDGEAYKHAIDYTRSADETFVKFSRLFINQSKSIDLLSLVSECLAAPELPSWVVQWEKIQHRFPALLNPFGSGADFNASGGFKLAAKQEASNQGELHLRGVVFDSLLTVHQWPSLQSATPENERPSQAMKEWQQLLLNSQKESQIRVLSSTIRFFHRQLLQRYEQHAHYENLDKALLNTLTCGKMRNKIDAMAEESNRVIEQLIPRPDLSVQKFEERWGYDFLHDMTAAWYSYRLKWRFIQTARGHVGLALNSAVEGDLICVLSGGSVPFVLREVAEKRGQYKLVGPVYIEGIMNGETMEGKKERDLQDFSLV